MPNGISGVALCFIQKITTYKKPFPSLGEWLYFVIHIPFKGKAWRGFVYFLKKSFTASLGTICSSKI